MKTLIENSNVNLTSLKEVKEFLTAHISAVKETLPAHILDRAIVEGIYRQLSAETAKTKDGTPEKAKEVLGIFERMQSGFYTETDKNKALAPVKGAGTASRIKFSRTEILGAMRDEVPADDKETAKKLKVVESYDDVKFMTFVETMSQRPESLVSKALAELTARAIEKATAEKAAIIADLVDL